MTSYLNPKTGATIGYPETKGTTAEPFNVPMAWQSSSLSYVTLNADSNGNLLVSGGITGTFNENLAQVGGVNISLGQKVMASSIPVAIASDYVPVLQQDLIGNAHNYYPNRIRGFVFGKAPVVNNTRVDLWEGPTTTYVFPTTPIQMQVVSTNANDTAAGTGVQKVHLHYLDTNYNIQSEQVFLNGLTPVLTVATNILRINGFHAVQIGSGGTSAGNISLQAVGGAVTYGFITAGFDTARQAIYTVPAGLNGYISHWQASSGSSGNHFCQIALRATTHDGILYPGVFLVQDEQGSQNGGDHFTLPIPIQIPPKTDVKITAISDNPAAGVIAMGSIMGWFEQ